MRKALPLLNLWLLYTLSHQLVLWNFQKLQQYLLRCMLALDKPLTLSPGTHRKVFSVAGSTKGISCVSGQGLWVGFAFRTASHLFNAKGAAQGRVFSHMQAGLCMQGVQPHAARVMCTCLSCVVSVSSSTASCPAFYWSTVTSIKLLQKLPSGFDKKRWGAFVCARV